VTLSGNFEHVLLTERTHSLVEKGISMLYSFAGGGTDEPDIVTESFYPS
jgi:hypothetical protein